MDTSERLRALKSNSDSSVDMDEMSNCDGYHSNDNLPLSRNRLFSRNFSIYRSMFPHGLEQGRHKEGWTGWMTTTAASDVALYQHQAGFYR
ncbi:predicted protein [Lichtheimia corymbifera JMRC:FSU:9682]|uniref:Uncharacterized protein n=1 Tax=Lichtheimia corymbifera JMRC:FSU:9682 TaxID=1263082 RepID=A0A068SAM3_9FUNG|nr:predicted protein [Lichtheimia corymbifera JMRC:FSU:9682]